MAEYKRAYYWAVLYQPGAGGYVIAKGIISYTNKQYTTKYALPLLYGNTEYLLIFLRKQN